MIVDGFQDEKGSAEAVWVKWERPHDHWVQRSVRHSAQPLLLGQTFAEP
jgi:hypothetical protein